LSHFYKFLEEELAIKKNWDRKKIEKYIRDPNVLPSMTQKIEILIRDVLGLNIDKGIYDAWSNDVRGPRNAIIHGAANMYGQYKFNSAIKAVIASSNFIIELLNSLSSTEHLEYIKKNLIDYVGHLQQQLKMNHSHKVN